MIYLFGIGPWVVFVAILVWYFMPTFNWVWNRHKQLVLIREGRHRRAELHKVLYFKKLGLEVYDDVEEE